MKGPPGEGDKQGQSKELQGIVCCSAREIGWWHDLVLVLLSSIALVYTASTQVTIAFRVVLHCRVT
jgi:hypothetical protein